MEEAVEFSLAVAVGHLGEGDAEFQTLFHDALSPRRSSTCAYFWETTTAGYYSPFIFLEHSLTRLWTH